jgi:hypothetical protein
VNDSGYAAEERDLSLPPHSLQAEEAVLGSILKSPPSIAVIADFLRPDDFYVPRNGLVFGAMLSLVRDGVPIDYHTVGDRLYQRGQYEQVGGMMYLSEINLATPTAAYIEHYGRIVERTSIMRQLISSGQSIAELAYRDNLEPETAIDKAERLISAVSEKRMTRDARLRFSGLSLAQLRQRPTPSYILDGYLQSDSVALLEGIDGSYKTFLALGWAHCVALGRPWFGRSVRQGRVLYLLGEGGRGLPRRADAWQIVHLGGRQCVDDLVFVVDEMPQLWKGDASLVVAANPGPFALIVADTLARTMLGGNENLQQDMGLHVAACDQLRRAYDGACILNLHHLNASGGTRGSTSLPGAIDTKLRLTRESAGSHVVTLSNPKQREDDSQPPLQLVARTVELGTVDDRGRPETSMVLELLAEGRMDPAVDPLSESERKAMNVLMDPDMDPVGIVFADWRDRSGLSKTTFQRARVSLIQRGMVEHTADAHYRPTPQGPQGPFQGPLENGTLGIGTGSIQSRGLGTNPWMDPPARTLFGGSGGNGKGPS